MIRETRQYFFNPAVNSDKEYRTWIEQDPLRSMWVLHFSYGRRGSSLKAGSKGRFGELRLAAIAQDQLVNAKAARGYTIQMDRRGQRDAIPPQRFTPPAAPQRGDSIVPVPPQRFTPAAAPQPRPPAAELAPMARAKRRIRFDE